MRVFGSRGSREHPPSHRLSGRVKQIDDRVDPHLQNESGRPSSGGRWDAHAACHCGRRSVIMLAGNAPFGSRGWCLSVRL
jgi:hypothetical protein